MYFAAQTTTGFFFVTPKFNIAVVPEPSTLALWVAALLAWLVRRRFSGSMKRSISNDLAAESASTRIQGHTACEVTHR
jgi:hypothetical protein